MELFQKYEIRKSNQLKDEYTLVLYLDDNLSEFADELGILPKARRDVMTTARQIIKERYPAIKVTMVKVILGGIVVTSIPLSTNISSAKASELPVTTSEMSIPNSIYYHVSPGDTLWNISVRFNTSVDHIKKANKLTSDILRLNQGLIIPKAFHTVAAGDYLLVLAKKYGTTVDAIKAVNNLTSDSIRIGQTLIIPASIGGATTDHSPTASILPTEMQKSTYTVIAGDSLSIIAKRFGVTVEALRNSNKLTSDVLRIGQVLAIPILENASTPPTSQAETTYTIVSGDNLYSVAKQFGTTVDILKSINQLKSDTLQIGQTLTIPKEGTVTNSEKSVPPTTATTHIVLSGETLWGIASRYGTNVDVLRNINNLQSNTLKIGQTITIPSTNSDAVQPNPISSTEPIVQEERNTFTYSVRSGDNLSVIANRFGVTIDSIRNANSLKTDILQVGQLLTIQNGQNVPAPDGTNKITYTTHTVVSGDNIWDLSVRYGVPQAELLRANNLTASSMLSVGQKLTIPVHSIAVKPVISEKHGEYMDWWTEAQYVFSIGKTAKVTDFTTGKSFYIKRTIGANHADSETLTVNDSTIAKSIWGGYSWTPRAIILEVDGRKIAASMSFMPHEREYIANNGITGHFDVYFGNSTRHIDGRADASHQTQVEKAAGMR